MSLSFTPGESPDNAIAFAILVDGKLLPDEYAVSKIQVVHAVNRLSSASIVLKCLAETVDGEASPAPAANEPAPGKRISISAGYAADAMAGLFDGFIAGQQITIDAGNQLTVTLHCQHDWATTNQTAADVFFAGKTDSEMIQAIADDQGLPVKVTATETIREAVFEPQQTGWDFILQRCRLNGFICTTSGDTVTIGPPNLTQKPVLKITRGDNLISLQAGQTAGMFATDRPTGFGLTGQVVFTGHAGIKSGDLLTLAGMGSKTDGDVFARSVTHSLAEGIWTTELDFGFPPGLITEKPASTGSSAAYRLQTATINKITGDPQQQYRVQIEIDAGAEQPVLLWARLAAFYATAGAGSLFYPEAGDEVLVGFLPGDDCSPVVLGSLFSREHTPGKPAHDEHNYIKAFTSRTGLQLLFDEEKKNISLLTPGNNSIIISDHEKSIELKDQNSNCIKLSADGILIKSSKDIKIAATGNIDMSAVSKINASAQQDLVLSGLNVNAMAQIGLTVKGSATAELSAAGQTTVKGAIVMIN